MKHHSLTLCGGSIEDLRLAPASASPPANSNALAVRTGSLVISKPQGQSFAWETVAGIIEFLYPFESFTFTNAGATGNLGPTLAQCLAAYGPNAPFVGPEQTYLSMGTRGMQRLVVPTTGLYRITAIGATCTGQNARPAIVDMDVHLTINDVLTIAIGQQGSHTHCGAGGTWVSHSGVGLLAVAGGAGGAARIGVNTPPYASITQQASSQIYADSVRGSNSVISMGGAAESTSNENGSSWTHAGGGAGFNGDGSIASTIVAAKSFSAGCQGGTFGSYQGGFGGGGASNGGSSFIAVAGSGGYTGGRASASRNNRLNNTGAGGGSFAYSGAERVDIQLASLRSAQGSVRLELLEIRA